MLDQTLALLLHFYFSYYYYYYYYSYCWWYCERYSIWVLVLRFRLIPWNILCLPPSWNINWLSNLGYKMCLLFLELEYPSSFLVVTTECCSWNNISRQNLKIGPNVQFTWAVHGKLLLPFIDHVTTTQLECGYHVL